MLVGQAPIRTWSPDELCVCGVALVRNNPLRPAKADLVEVQIGQMRLIWWLCHINSFYLIILSFHQGLNCISSMA
jgi:hypothetical protein